MFFFCVVIVTCICVTVGSIPRLGVLIRIKILKILKPICLCGCGQEVGHCESFILYHKDLYIFVKVSQVTIFDSSLDTFINTNTTPKGGAPAQAEYTSKKERKDGDSDKCLISHVE